MPVRQLPEWPAVTNDSLSKVQIELLPETGMAPDLIGQLAQLHPGTGKGHLG